jgi:adenylate cyclase class 2
MPAHREIEIKFEVRDQKQLTRKLKAFGFRLTTARTLEVNTLYDFPRQMLRQRGEMLRIRNYGGKWTITHKAKGTPGRHKSRVETETTMQDGEKLQAIFASLGLRPIFRYEKYRAEWSDGIGHLVLDETPIGSYAELEGPPHWIDRTAKRLGVTRDEYITDNYAGLFWAWKNRTDSTAEEMTFRAVKRKHLS